MSQHLAIVFNRPALDSLAYRIGTYLEFRRQLEDGLADSDNPALARLTTRDPADFTLALIDAWACALDLVTFYQERTADESYLRTAKEFLSVRELARQIGYVPSPGLAASALLAVTVGDSPGDPERVRVEPGLSEQGLSVLSVPGPGEPPATFEAVESLELRPALNGLPALRTSPDHVFTGELLLAGVATGLRAGDLLVLVEDLRIAGPKDDAPAGTLLFSSADARLVRLDEVVVDDKADSTRVTWSGLGFHPRSGKVFALAPQAEVPPRPDPEGLPVVLLDGGPLVRLGADHVKVLPFAGYDPRTSPVVIVTDGERFDLYPSDFGDQVRPNDGRTPLTRFRPGAIRILHNFKPLPVVAGDPLKIRDDIHLAGSPALAPGDGLLVTDGAGDRWAFALVAAVRRDLARNTLAVSPQWTAGAQARLIPGDDLRVHVLRQRSPLYGHNAPDEFTVPLNYTKPDLDRKFGPARTVQLPGFSQPVTFEPITSAAWIGLLHPPSTHVDLAQAFPQLQPGAVFLLVDGGAVSRYVASEVTTLRRQDFTLDALITRLHVAQTRPDAPSKFQTQPRATSEFQTRTALAFFAPEPLALAEFPLSPELAGPEILVQGAGLDLPPGRTLIVSGQDLAGKPAAEIVRLVTSTARATFTRLHVSPPLARTYRRASVSVLANVVRATHGETVDEVLGSGDATRAFQRFPLSSGPLTFTSAATATGRRSSLEVRVSGLLWREVDSLETFGPSDRVYTLITDQDGRTFVQFGDGIRGARLPTGASNVRAVYRKGIGREGLVRPDALSLPIRKPTGVKAVRNPLPAAGAADPEPLTDARRNATRTVIALDRVVSLRDYEDFARAFTGVAKAQATRLGPTGVALTVAGPGGAAIEPGTDLYSNLRAALRDAGDPTVFLALKGFRRVPFVVAGTVRRAPEVLAEDLAQAVRAALLARYGFDAQDFAAPVFLSEVIATVQSVPGVVAFDLDLLARGVWPPDQDKPKLEDLEEPPARPPARLDARQRPSLAFLRPTAADDQADDTELLLLDPDSLLRVEVAP